MIIFIMLITIISVGLLGIIIVIVYACVTTKTLHDYCSSLVRRQPSKMYVSDEEYAERACDFEGRDRDSKELDSEFQKSIEFDGDQVQSDSSTSSVSSEDTDSDTIMTAQKSVRSVYCQHHRPYGGDCDCREESDDQFDPRYRATYNANILSMNTPTQLTQLTGMIV